jgi:hypothetical protein
MLFNPAKVIKLFGKVKSKVLKKVKIYDIMDVL